MAGNLNSITITGLYTPSSSGGVGKYYFEIVDIGVGNAATYKWKEAGGAWSTAAACSGNATEFDSGLFIAFNQSDSYLGGPYPDTWIVLAEAQKPFHMDTLGWLEDGSKRDLIGYDKNAGTIKIMRDFYGAKSQASPGVLKHRPTDVTIIPNNKEVHIGCGPDKPAQWLGRNQFPTFGGVAKENIELSEAKLSCSLSEIGFFDTACFDQDGNIWGAEFEGTKLLFMEYVNPDGNANGYWEDPVEIADVDFGGILKVSFGLNSYADDGYIWILDSGSDKGILYKYDIEDDTRQLVGTSGIVLDSGFVISDMICINHNQANNGLNYQSIDKWDIWLSAYKKIDDNYTPSVGRGILWQATTTNYDGVTSLSFTNRDPLIKNPDGTEDFGQWKRTKGYTCSTFDPAGYDYEYEEECVGDEWSSWSNSSGKNWYTQTYRRALCHHPSTDYVYHLARYRPVSSSEIETDYGKNSYNTEYETVTITTPPNHPEFSTITEYTQISAWCNLGHENVFEHVFVSTSADDGRYLYGTSLLAGVKNDYTPNDTSLSDSSSIHYIAMDKLDFTLDKDWEGPSGMAFSPKTKRIYMSSDWGTPFYNGNKWIIIPVETDHDDSSFEECGDYEVCDDDNQDANYRIWAKTIIYDSDRTDLLDDIANGTSNQPDYGLLLGGSVGNKVIYIVGLDPSITQGNVGRPVSKHKIYDATNINITFTPTDDSGDSTRTWSNKKLFYKVSFTYDGYQESPLSEETWTLANDNDLQKSVSVKIQLDRPSEINSRVSHINLYRANGPESISDADKPLGLYRLVESRPSTAWVNKYQSVAYIEDTSDALTGSYESRSGISETMTNTTVRWGIGTVAAGCLIVGDCGTDEFSDASTYLFKSKPGDFDKFNWSMEYLRLPFKPVAITSFQGRVYCWSTNTMLRINPDQFYIEDTFDGFGCLNKKAVIVTEHGMFFADKNNIYMHNGQSPVPIGVPIIQFTDEDSPSGKGYIEIAADNADKVVMSFDAKRGAVICFMNNDDTEDDASTAFVYNVNKGRWDIWSHTALTDAVTGEDGYIYQTDGVNNNRFFRYMGHDEERRDWKWHSKRLDADQPSQDKIFKKLRIVSDSTDAEIDTNLDVYYRIAGNKSQLGLDATANDYEKISSADKKAKDVKLMLESKNNFDMIVNSVGAIFRRRPVK
tara:strand:- start:1311 stop:4823 length:3513 start_codon:yes stop_codon:yes gene_type:complete